MAKNINNLQGGDLRNYLRTLTKKEVIKAAGYKNIKKLCNANPDLRSKTGKAPSKNDIIREMV